MFEFHKDKERYFNWQYLTARDYLLPFIAQSGVITKDMKVLEIGCGEAGVLKAFIERGHECMGIDLNPGRIENANRFHAEAVASGQVQFISRDIYKIDPNKDLNFKFDLIILKDVIEHIPHQDQFLHKLKDFLTPKGKVFFAFPPWQMPFGGHQQICKNKWMSKLGYVHLLPRPIYKSILKMFGEPAHVIQELMELKDTGLSIEHFKRILSKEGYTTEQKKFWLINPIYKFKFNLKERTQFGWINALPFVRNFWTTCAYFLVSADKSHKA